MTRLRSTGQEIVDRTPVTVTPERVRELRHTNPGNARREELAQRRWDEIAAKESKHHDEAVSFFDESYKDVTSNPHLLREAVILRQEKIQEAAQKRQVLDWFSTYSDIGEEVRRKAGLPTSDEQRRIESLGMMRKARGLE